MHWGWGLIDIFVIGTIDLSEYVLSDGIKISLIPTLHQVTDLQGNTHSKRVTSKKSLSASLGTIPDSIVDKLETEIDKADVTVKVGEKSYTMTSMSVSRSASYIDAGEIWWSEIEISGVQA